MWRTPAFIDQVVASTSRCDAPNPPNCAKRSATGPLIRLGEGPNLRHGRPDVPTRTLLVWGSAGHSRGGSSGPSASFPLRSCGTNPVVTTYAACVTRITTLCLPIDWTAFAWPSAPSLGGVTLVTDDPRWAWEPAAPAFPLRTMETANGDPIEGFSIDHVVLLVPDLEAAVSTMERIGIAPRLRMTLRGGRPAAFFRVGTVLEVIQAPVREASLYGIAVTTDGSLESLALAWKGLGLEVGDITPAIQPGRRIMTVHGLDAGFAVMSADAAIPATDR